MPQDALQDARCVWRGFFLRVPTPPCACSVFCSYVYPDEVWVGPRKLGFCTIFTMVTVTQTTYGVHDRLSHTNIKD